MTDEEGRPEVVLMCGLAGSGKTTHAKELETRGYVRLSVDEEVWKRFGRFGVDYDSSLYEGHSAVARRFLDERLTQLVSEGRAVVVDSSLWQRERRNEAKRLVERAGGRWRLVYLKTSETIVRERLAKRAERFDANAAFPITDEIFAQYLGAFEEPSGEGEEVVFVTGD